MKHKKDTAQTGEQMTLFSAEAFHASPIHSPENDSAKRMSAICGPRCLESFAKFNRPGLWAKMFSALLIGRTDWYSTRCRLTWKLRGTKYNRMYFQLVPQTLRTDVTEFGLLPTPTASDSMELPSKLQTGKIVVGKSGAISFIRNKDGMSFGASMREVVKALPMKNQIMNEMHSGETGTTSQLNPRFVLEMMGFPPDWTELPFRNGETKASKLPETP